MDRKLLVVVARAGHARGSLVSSDTGRLYRVSEDTGRLHLRTVDGVLSEPGVHPDDEEHFRTFPADYTIVEPAPTGASKPAPTTPPAAAPAPSGGAPVTPAGASGGGEGTAPAAPAAPAAPPPPPPKPVLPAPIEGKHTAFLGQNLTKIKAAVVAGEVDADLVTLADEEKAGMNRVGALRAFEERSTALKNAANPPSEG